MYNRSRIVNILQKFDEAVGANIYPSLPSLHEIDFSLLKCPEESKIIRYICEFYYMLDQFQVKEIKKITAKLWRFLLFMSQEYSAYYSRFRTLCVRQKLILKCLMLFTYLIIFQDENSGNRAVMYARIWMLKSLLTIYNCSLSLLDIQVVDYLWYFYKARILRRGDNTTFRWNGDKTELLELNLWRASQTSSGCMGFNELDQDNCLTNKFH